MPPLHCRTTWPNKTNAHGFALCLTMVREDIKAVQRPRAEIAAATPGYLSHGLRLAPKAGGNLIFCALNGEMPFESEPAAVLQGSFRTQCYARDFCSSVWMQGFFVPGGDTAHKIGQPGDVANEHLSRLQDRSQFVPCHEPDGWIGNGIPRADIDRSKVGVRSVLPDFVSLQRLLSGTSKLGTRSSRRA